MEQQPRKNGNNRLVEYYGTTQYYKHNFTPFAFTDGVHAARDIFQCYWLVDQILLTMRIEVKLQAEGYYIWKLSRIHDSSQFKLTCTFYEIMVYETELFSDFEDDELTMYFNNGILFLPSED